MKWNKWRAREADPSATIAMVEKGYRYGSLLSALSERKNASSENLVFLSKNSTDFLTHLDLVPPSDLRVRLDLSGADLEGANLNGANLSGVLLNDANLKKANLYDSNLSEADLYGTDLSGAKIVRTNLMYAHLVNVKMNNAVLADSYVYGVSAWDTDLSGAVQSNLIITRNEPKITVDDLKVAQFIYLILSHQGIRDIIDAITTKVVLILGRFTPKRKKVLEVVRIFLRNRGYVPVLFDFPRPKSRDLTETISILAHLACFVLVDLTEARSVPHELMRIVPALPSLPVQPICRGNERIYGMFEHFARFPWVLEPIFYQDPSDIQRQLPDILMRLEEGKKGNIGVTP